MEVSYMLPLSDSTVQRAAVFAHFDIDNKIDDYVIYLLNKLRDVCKCIIFVTTSDPVKQEISKIESLCERVIVRENIGHDFMSYKYGLSELDKNKYDEIVICNDSVYGPFFPFSDVFNKMNGTECDFWGITENKDFAHHLQSYFVVFRRKVIQSSCFRDFWENVSVENDKFTLIKKYEIGLSQLLVKAHFVPDSYTKVRSSFLKTLKIRIASVSIKNYAGMIRKLRRLVTTKVSLNPTHFYWKELITKYNMPFIKVAVVRDSFKNINTENYPDILSKCSAYDTGLIQKHLERVKGRYLSE